MLYPQSNERRSVLNLNGIWNYAFVSDDYVPLRKAENASPMAVPASMNDIVVSKNSAKYVGKVLYEREFSMPVESRLSYRLRIGAVSHRCEVYLNGEKIGCGVNGFIPVDLPLENLKAKNRLSVIIDNRLTGRTLPMGEIEKAGIYHLVSVLGGEHVVDRSAEVTGQKQIIKFDFYNFTGIHRDVLVYGLPENAVEDVTIKTVVGGDYEKIRVDVKTDGKVVRYTVFDGEVPVATSADGDITLKNPSLWSPKNPHLYTLRVETENDCYEQTFGVRKVAVDEKGLTLNGERVYLKGFGKHEDFFISGKGNNSAVNVRDFELLKWINANSIRTSHYPYAEEIMDLADRYGIMVIDEVPAVGVGFWNGYTFGKGRADEETLALHKQVISALVDRDKNRPCVIMLSVANETATYEDASRPYYKEVIDHARSLTDLPITLAESTKSFEGSRVADMLDIICVNRYYGWYDEPAELDAIETLCRDDLDKYYAKFRKPMILTEFGADTIEGFHSLQGEMFSEEFQTELLAETCRVLDTLPYIVGEQVWNFADFKTREGVMRVRGNRKGVFTKERQPKSAAFYLKERWKNKE